MALIVRHTPTVAPAAVVLTYHCRLASDVLGDAPIASVESQRTDASWLSPPSSQLDEARRVAGASPATPVAIVGYSAGCQPVRHHVLAGHRLAAVVTIDGTHSSWPMSPAHIDAWRQLARDARAGSVQWLATCTQQTYTEQLPQGAYAATRTVLEAATGLELAVASDRPQSGVRAGGGYTGAPAEARLGVEHRDGALLVQSYASASMDAAEHAAQATVVLPRLVRAELVPWLLRDTDERPTVPDLTPAPWGMRALTWSISQLGVSERTAAGQRLIESYHAEVGGRGWLTYRDAWCASFASTAGKRTRQPGDDEPHALTYRVRTLWESAIQRRTAVPIAEVRRDPRRYLQPGNLLCMSRGALPVGGAIAGDGHVARIEGYGGGRVHTVDGNLGDEVARREYELADPHLVGVVLYPGGESIDTWEPTAEQLEQMVAMAEQAFGERLGVPVV